MNSIKTSLLTSIIPSFLIIFSLVFNVASAKLIQADYLNVGDNGAVLDTQTGLRWLDLTHTHGLNYDDASTFTSNYRYATNSELETLFNLNFSGIAYAYHGIAISVDDELEQAALNFSEVFGIADRIYSYGMYKDENNEFKIAGVHLSSPKPNVYGPDVIFDYSYSAKNGIYLYGTYLVEEKLVDTSGATAVSNAVPVSEPITIQLFFLASLMLLKTRRKKL